ncbi:glucoamylase family protein [soil metagenome]
MLINPASTQKGLLSRLSRKTAPGRAEVLSGPIQGELLGSDRLAEKARTVAARQVAATDGRGRRSTPLLERLANTRVILRGAHAHLSAGARREIDIGPAGDWLLDNFHVVQEHIREVIETLPSRYYRELPELTAGHLSGYPRVYELAIALISHSEGRVDLDNLELFVEAFQSETPLSIGELWALPAMFRLALIESVRRMALRTVQRMDEIEKADQWVERISNAGQQSTDVYGEALDAFVSDPPRLSAVFVSRFLHQLRLTRSSYPPLAQIEQWITDQGVSAEDADARSTHHLALTQVMMAHSLTSLRTIAHLDWRGFVERHSVMDRTLREDPAAFYSRMTFSTRDAYRHVVERVAKRSGLDEAEVARTVVDLAAEAADADKSAPRSHVGYYLIDNGLDILEIATGYKSAPGEAINRWVLRHPNIVFGGGILIGTATALLAVLWLSGAWAAWPIVFLLAFIPATDIAINAMNQFVTAFLPPRALPKLDMEDDESITSEIRTAVVVPTLFASVEAVHEALDHLEVQFLANRKTNLHFAVLSDFTDASEETLPQDTDILSAAAEGVRALNDRYAEGLNDAFYLFHRPRRWNAQQGVWMGWERKRGKLSDFNRFIRGEARDAFTVVVGDIATLQTVRYVITLDADTVLPPDAAGDLIGALAHPLNHAVYDPDEGRVVRGYGILQPRVGVSLPSAHRSIFSAVHSGHPGVDPYTTAVSDVYQDLYGEGSFTGKGIYDVDAFEQSTHGRFPENTLLSHDLIEGSYARAGLATEITVYDDYPARYLTYTRRKHRWIRGDWQLLGWLMPRVPGPDGPAPNRLLALSRWKILDNLRRSTVEIGQFVFIVAGLTVLPGSPLRWLLLGIAAVAAPWVVSLLLAALRPPMDKSWRTYYASVGRDATTSVKQIAITLAALPHQAWISADAILRTLWRTLVSRRYLLEWQTASAAERSASGSLGQVWREMWPAVGLSLGILAAALLIGPALRDSGEAAIPFWVFALAVGPIVALWVSSPVIVHAISALSPVRDRHLPEAYRGDAMRYALLHWRYFDRFVTAETQWLAPDNYQENPTGVVAMRTSPTNIGMHLLVFGSAFDLGFITREEMVRRLERAFRSLERMRRHRGHFFNWYDLHDLHVMEPAYISTVDSGNLAGHLIALRQACLEAQTPRGDDDARLHDALTTAFGLAEDRIQDLGRANPALQSAVEAPLASLKGARMGLADANLSGMPLDMLLNVAAAIEDSRAALWSALPETAELDPADEWLIWSQRRIEEHQSSESVNLADLSERLGALAQRADAYVSEMDFRFLFDDTRKLFSIGHQYHTHSLDGSFYDLFASEARLASFVAIAKNDVPVDHWFRMGRSLTRASGHTALVSWSGSMFEYLMPALVMRSYPFTLLDQSYQGAVGRQVSYGVERDVPWGVSESAYNLRDRHLTYQYRAFGVPDLALKRGLGQDLVIAPYASVLAVMVDPERSMDNLATLERLGALGPYGFRDALDFTRPDPERRFAVVGNYMAHHIGMALVAFTNLLKGGIWQDRFHADPLVRSAELLLHEQIPRRLALRTPQATSADEALPDPDIESPAVREYDQPDTPRPHIGLLGRYPYTLMLTHAGSGYSRYEDLAVTRWRADGTTDATGQFCYVKDVGRGRKWSVAHQPLCAKADSYRAFLATDRVTFCRTDDGIETLTEIAVVPEDAAEVRLVRVSNHGDGVREIELTSYGEIVLGPPDADRAHPAFANLFVETEWHEWCSALTATRRPRSASEPSLWCVHVVATGAERIGPVSYETDRAQFIGRGRTTATPKSLTEDGPLSGTTGAVLDPIFALRTRVRLGPGESAAVAFTTLVATSRERAFELADRYDHLNAAQRALDLAWTSQQVELRELDLTPADAAVFQELAGCLFFPHPALRLPQHELYRNEGSQPLLWENGISGDWPIVLATINSADGITTLRQLLAAHHYWRRRGMTVDLVIINTQAASYLQTLHNRITDAMFATGNTEMEQPGGVFIRRQDQISSESLQMLEATARVLIPCDGRTLSHVLEIMEEDADKAVTMPGAPESHLRKIEQQPLPAPRAGSGRGSRHDGDDISRVSSESPSPSHPPDATEGARQEAADPRFENGYGGLTPNGDYEMLVQGDAVPPAPWANVVANPHGGFVVSERGAGFTWAENSYFYRLTPWQNDPVSDPVSEILYLRDEETGALWSATPAPVRSEVPYTVRHGAGTTEFVSQHTEIETHLTLGMAEGEAVKLSVLRITNHDSRPRRLSVTAFVEWTLGVMREHTQHQVRTRFEPEMGAILAQNFFDPQFSGRIAFCALSEPITDFTGDRREFLGRNGTVEDPAALRTGSLNARTGIGFDPCAALQCVLELAPNESREVVMILGAVMGVDEAREAIARHRAPGAAATSINEGVDLWTKRLSVVKVKTPDPLFDAMINRWTLYQALSCRMWARSAVYQSSGAYGFRDQLQDVLAFVYAEPELAREHILRASARQFLEGDVQHWLHPQSGRGVRTRFSDDLAWLPYVVDQYVNVTGDASVLDEYVPFLEMRTLGPDEHEVYDLPQVSEEHGSVYEHCLRALRKAFTTGRHGLPLIGVGDWNDGMSRVGIEGRGESVWLAWFLTATLRAFAEHAFRRGDHADAEAFRKQADDYVQAVEAHGWDGQWYRRAYFDDGTPLGSSESDECRIDSIAQSWSVISGAGDPERQTRAMQSFEEHLVRPDARLLMLLTPPFDKAPHDPGYIKGYLPGVRENGAQYTHAALWAVLANAMRGEGERAFELYQMLNPLTHTQTPEGVERYKVEPYVVAADVYTAPGQLGRGGWTWYTGSASWMYRVGLEAILGFTKRGDSLRVEPCVPAAWPEFSISYRFGSSSYEITVHNPGALLHAEAEVTLDGRVLDTADIPLVDDGNTHVVAIRRLPNL